MVHGIDDGLRFGAGFLHIVLFCQLQVEVLLLLSLLSPVPVLSSDPLRV